MKMKIIKFKELMLKTLYCKNYSKYEAEKIAEVLLYAEIAGKGTQGILKLLDIEPARDIKLQYPPKIIKETELSALIDGGGSSGIYSAQIATEKVIEIAKKKGFGIVGTK